MRTVLFTKLFGSRGLDEIGPTVADLGFDGVDLLIRPGFSVTPDEADRLPRVVADLRALGLDVPMATTDLTDPANFPTAKVFGACAEAGVGLIRLGYWNYDGSRPYDGIRDQARRDLDELERLAASYGIALAIQLHGGTIHSSGALTRVLLEGRDPAAVSAYPDPGNQVVQDGREDWRLTFDVLRPWLRCVGVKNGGWFAGTPQDRGARAWQSDWLGLADGMVPWPEILDHLRTTGYDGLLSFHSHYELPYEQVLDQTRTDLRFVRRCLERAEAI